MGALDRTEPLLHGPIIVDVDVQGWMVYPLQSGVYSLEALLANYVPGVTGCGANRQQQVRGRRWG